MGELGQLKKQNKLVKVSKPNFKYKGRGVTRGLASHEPPSLGQCSHKLVNDSFGVVSAFVILRNSISLVLIKLLTSLLSIQASNTPNSRIRKLAYLESASPKTVEVASLLL